MQWRDFLPVPGRSLEAGLVSLLKLPPVQIECSGTAALIVALATLKNASTRRSVIIPAYTCPLVALAILQCGLRPIVCDLRRNHFDLCPQTLEEVCGEDTLAIVPTHLGGRVADVENVIAIARRVGALVIEDAAQSMGATWRGHPVGIQGDAGFYSMAVGKGLTIYEGGVLVARDESMRWSLRNTGEWIAPCNRILEIRRMMELACYAALYRPVGLRVAYGIPLRRALGNENLIEAAGDVFSAGIPLHKVSAWRKAVGANALTRLSAFLETLTAQGTARKTELTGIPGVTVMDDPEGGRGVWPFLMVLMATEKARDAALGQLWPAGLGVGRLYIHALPDYPYLAVPIGKADVPNARDFAARMLTISNSPWLHETDFRRVLSVLEKCA